MALLGLTHQRLRADRTRPRGSRLPYLSDMCLSCVVHTVHTQPGHICSITELPSASSVTKIHLSLEPPEKCCQEEAVKGSCKKTATLEVWHKATGWG